MARLTSILSSIVLLLAVSENGVVALAVPTSSPRVTVPFEIGATVTFEGTTTMGRNDETVSVFYGIPYGQEPERWRTPAKKIWHESTFNATHSNFQPCLQPNAGNNAIVGSNDCLKLNIWKPNNATSSSNLPVMVFIHGGDYLTGGISTSNSDSDAFYLLGQNLVDDTVVVDLQFREGVFGFLGSDMLRNRSFLNATGTYGILDQRLALEWVHYNIHAFGGDPSNVFLFGQSSGAGSVAVHLMSEDSWPYFTSAGLESGAFRPDLLSYWQRTASQFDSLMDSINCSTVECLLDQSDEALLLGNNISRTLPAVDGVVIPLNFSEALASGRVHRVPVLMGTNEHEATIRSMVGGIYLAGGGKSPFNTTEEDLTMMRCLGNNLTTRVNVPTGNNSNVKTSLSELFKFSKLPVTTPPVTVNEILSPAYWEMVAITTTSWFGCPTVSAAEKISSEAPVYMYSFRAQPNFTTANFGGLVGGDPVGPIPGSAGVGHGIELVSVFSAGGAVREMIAQMAAANMSDPLGVPLDVGVASDEAIFGLEEMMSQAWINFAKFHYPGLGWRPWTKHNPSRAIFDYEMTANIIRMESGAEVKTQCAVIAEIDTCDRYYA